MESGPVRCRQRTPGKVSAPPNLPTAWGRTLLAERLSQLAADLLEGLPQRIAKRTRGAPRGRPDLRVASRGVEGREELVRGLAEVLQAAVDLSRVLGALGIVVVAAQLACHRPDVRLKAAPGLTCLLFLHRTNTSSSASLRI